MEAPLQKLQSVHLNNGLLLDVQDADNGAALVGQLPPKRTSSKALVKKHRAHLKAQEAAAATMGNNGATGSGSPASQMDDPRPVKQVVLADAYPASTRSIRDLEIILLDELKVETHHDGKGLILKAATPAYRGVGAVSVVVDAAGNADKLAIYNHSDTSLLSNLPEGCVVAVKEPYYKYNGTPHDYMICVDHPSDVVLLRFNDPLIPKALRPATEEAKAALSKSPEAWRSAGDMAFLQRDFPTAAYCYTEALETVSDKASTFAADVYTKRAGVNLLLGRYDGARDDALVSRTGSAATDWRAYFTAAKATYGLCRYPESRGYFEQALSLAKQSTPTPTPSPPPTTTTNAAVDGPLQREHERCLARLREETEGSDAAYDFPAMYASLSLAKNQVHLDRGSFLRRTAVRRSAFHGNGLFALEPIGVGELVFVEKAAFMPNQYYDPTRASAALYATMVRQMCDNPSVAVEVLQPLYGGDSIVRTGHEGELVDGVPVVDVFLAETIRLKNCFSAPLATLDDCRPENASAGASASAPRLMAKGLWKHASYLNHSCVPNTMRSFLGDVMISRAVKPIAAGEEVFQQYIPVKADVRARQAELQAGWGFQCICPLCSRDTTPEAQAGHAHRRTLLQAAEKLASKHAPHRLPPDAAVRTMERLARQMTASYDETSRVADAYGPGQPRLGLVYPTMWLLRAHRCRHRHAKVVQYAEQTLQCFGYSRPPHSTDGNGAATMYSKPGASPLHTVHVVSALVYGAEAHRVLGQADEADAFEAAARLGLRMVTGFSDDLEVINEDNMAGR
ncbi:hypothetical protein SCUCBS95973_007769 [Sporothrix curviconia]|uniref:SET domain-containing protein n=1 Tax=Sporothrix curviconia TaxID=1260050 RepID=A0ABP0CHX7_9PEZI